jgi:hypothetical protein
MIYYIIGYVILIYVLVNLFKKVEKLTEQLELINMHMVKMHADLADSFSEMKAIDAKGGFETDDEIGTIFKNLKEVLDELEAKYGGIDE